MPGKLFGRSPQDLLLSAIRVGGTRLFLAGTRGLRAIGVLPPAFRPGRDPESLLVIALTPHLGDAVMLAPLLEGLKRAHPSLPIDLAIERGAAPLLQSAPELRRIYALRLGGEPPVGTVATIRRVVAVVREYWRHMRGARPAICLMPRWGDDLFRSFYLAVLTGAPRRIGFSSRVGWPRYPLALYRDAMLTDVGEGGSGMHEPLRFLHLAREARLLPPDDPFVQADRVSPSIAALAQSQPWQPLAQRLGLRVDERFAVIAAGASQQKKQWPDENWCRVCQELRGRGMRVVLLSGRSDAELSRRIQAMCPEGTILAAGVTSFAESAALLQHASLFLGSDSGPGHIAGAVGTPTVVLFIASDRSDADDPFSPDRNRPMGPACFVLRPAEAIPPCVDTCAATEPHCIRQITVDAVLECIELAMGEDRTAA